MVMMSGRWFAAVMITALLVVIVGEMVLYGALKYGDWRCGFPGIQCRRRD